MSSLKHVTRTAAHAAALVFGAFWLVATSAYEPARDCFTGIANPTRLQVVLGPLEPSGSDSPGCGALDGLVPGGTLVFDLSQGPRPDVDTGTCYGYQTEALTGVPGLVGLGPGWGSQSALTAINGELTSANCDISWYLRLFPEVAPPEEQRISPLDAGPGERWIVHRAMSPQGPPCGATLPELVTCVDRFVVASITELPAP